MDRSEDTLSSILVESGIMKPEEMQMAEYVIRDEHPDREGDELDVFIEAYLVNRDSITEGQLTFAYECQHGLRSQDPLVRTQTRMRMAKQRAVTLRKQFANNMELADEILKTGKRIERKSTSAEHLALGFFVGRDGVIRRKEE